MPAQQTPVELQPVKWQTSNMLAASFAQSGLAKWLSAVHNRSLKVCFRIRYVMSLYPQKHVQPHFDKTVQLILLWLQSDLRSTFEHKLLIPGTLEQWINQQREYFCLQIKEKSKTWPLFFPPFPLWAAEAELASQMSVQCFWCSWGIVRTDFQNRAHYCALCCVWWMKENDVWWW